MEKVLDLNEKFIKQEDQIEDTRRLLLNSSILQITNDNDELKKAVRIADNELKIIMLIDQVHFFYKNKTRITLVLDCEN